MAKFNPDVQQTNDPNYLKQSQGYDAPKASTTFEKIFEGVAGIGDGIVKTWDQANQNDIKQQAQAGVDSIRGEVGVDYATKEAASGNTLMPNENGTPLPGAVKGATGQVGRLKDAYDQGKINDSYYWGRVNALAKQIRTQYPGYRDEIDGEFSRITGANPANALRKAIQSDFEAASNKMSEAENKEMTFVNGNLPEVTQTMPDYFKRRSEGNPYSFDEVRARVAQKQTANAIVKDRMTQMDLLSKQNSLDADTAQSFGTQQANQLVNDAVAAGVQSLGAKIQDAIKSGKPIPPEQLQEFRAAYSQLRAKADVSINQFLNQPFGDDKTKTLASTIKDSSKIKSIKDNALANLDAMSEMLTNGQYGVFQMNAAMAKATQDHAQATVLQNSDAARKLSAAQAIAGQAINAVVLRHPQILDDFSEAMSGVHLSESVTGEGSITKQLDQLKNPNTKKIGRGAANRLMDDKVAGVLSKEMPDAQKINIAKSMFGDEEGSFLTKFTPGDQIKVFQRMTAPEFTKEMIRLKSTDPKTFDQYQKWATTSFHALLKTQASTVQDFNKFNADAKLSYDPATMQFRLEANDPLPKAENGSDMVRALDTGPMALAKKMSLNSAQAALATVNASLTNLKPILEASGKDPNALASVLTGFNPSDPKEVGMLEWLGNGILKGINTIQPVSPAKGEPAKAANPKAELSKDGGLQLADYTPEEVKGAIPDASVSEDGLDLVSLTDAKSIGRATGGVAGLLDKISGGESGGSYNKIYGGRELPLTDMTLGQVMALQSRMTKAGSPSTALGKYQFISSTLRKTAQALGMNQNTPFDEETQDRLAHALLKARGLDKYMSGGMSESAFLNNIAQEWAGVPMSNGRGFYDGDGLNRSKRNVGEMIAAIRGLKH